MRSICRRSLLIGGAKFVVAMVAAAPEPRADTTADCGRFFLKYNPKTGTKECVNKRRDRRAREILSEVRQRLREIQRKSAELRRQQQQRTQALKSEQDQRLREQQELSRRLEQEQRELTRQLIAQQRQQTRNLIRQNQRAFRSRGGAPGATPPTQRSQQ